MKSFYTVPMFALGGLCWEVSYYAGSQCRGEFLGSLTVDSGPGVCTSFNIPNVDSVMVSADGNTATSLQFYSGKGCTGRMLALQSNAGCAPFNLGEFKSVGTI